MAKPKGIPPLKNCSPDDVFSLVRKLGGLKIKLGGGKHHKITHISSGKVYTIPRRTPINSHLLRDFVKEYLVEILRFSEKEIYKHLWC